MHLTSSVVQQIEYGPDQISCTKFDKGSRELFKIGAGMPKSVTGGEMRWDATSEDSDCDFDERSRNCKYGALVPQSYRFL